MNFRGDVHNFAHALEARLTEFDLEKGVTGWKDGRDSAMLDGIDGNLSKLDDQLQGQRDPIQILQHALDIAAYAMMIADPERLAEKDTNDLATAEEAMESTDAAIREVFRDRAKE
jgi:PHD/YefM family antitoxin component YafN of YafNO toxin-antitoxin module